jgi:hypothetical protein
MGTGISSMPAVFLHHHCWALASWAFTSSTVSPTLLRHTPPLKIRHTCIRCVSYQEEGVPIHIIYTTGNCCMAGWTFTSSGILSRRRCWLKAHKPVWKL